MSAPLAGKFQDHYTILGVDPRATLEAIQIAYARLEQKYNLKTAGSGDQDKLDSVTLAFEVLTDPALRLEFDKVKGIDQDDANLMFAGLEFFEALGRQAGLRSAMLCILYDRRRKKPSKPSLSVRHIEGMIHATNDELNFSLFYLKQKGLVVGDDKSNLQITVDGMDFLERDQPAPEKVFPYIKPSALSIPAEPTPVALALAIEANTPTHVAPSVAPTVTNEAESLLKVMSRALARR
jgi:curved DNA-binding protein CbpA